MKNILLTEATPEQVRLFALMLGVDLAGGETPDLVMAKLRTLYSGDKITVADEPPIDSGFIAGEVRFAPEDRAPGESSEFSKLAGAQRMKGSIGRDDPRVVLTLQKARVGNDVSKADVSVGVNGVAFQLKTGVQVDVPYRVYEALNNAMRNEVTHDDEGEVVEALVHAYPFNVHEMPSRAEIAAWRERIDAEELA